MKISDKGSAVLADYESISLTPYLDGGGVKTLGIGSTISDIPDIDKWPWDKAITIPEAIAIYRKSIIKYENAVNKNLKVEVSQEMFDALCSITYNIGTAGLASSTFLSRINNNDSPSRIAEAWRRWNKDNGRVVPGLINRREKEINLFLHKRYGDGTVSVFAVDPVSHKPLYNKSHKINFLDYLTNK